MFMGLLTADALTPFLPTIQLSQVWGSLKRSHFSILEGLSLHPWHWWLTTRLLVYMVLTFLLAVWNRSATRDRRWGKALLLTTLFAVSLEFVKPMIVSRSINLANIAISVLGIILAILIGPRLADRLSRRRKLDAAIVALLVYLFYLAWTPFSFVWNEDLFRQKLPAPIELLPFYHYAMGSTLNHARLFVQSVAVQGILVYLLRMRFEWFEHNRFRLALALMLVVMLGLLQEGGQMFLPTRVPSMTDIYCFMIGGALGSMLPRSRQHDAGQEYVNG
jgi:VanZ family protein